MDRNTVLIALGLSALAALFVAVGFRGQERRVEARAEMPQHIEAEADGAESARWLEGLTRQDRGPITLLCVLVSFASYLWILVCAFREHFGWGLPVLFGSGLGAVLFTVFHPRQSLLPLFLMFGGLGVSWAARFAAVA